jgi:hypothetical protein
MKSNNSNEKIETESVELERDLSFSRHLENDWQFEPRPAFQADLWNRLATRLENNPAHKDNTGSRNWFRFPALRGWQLVTVVFMLLAASSLPSLLLISALASPAPEIAAQNTPASQTTLPTELVAFTRFRDTLTGQELNAEETTGILGYTPAQPSYLPSGYKTNSAALTQATARNVTGKMAAASPVSSLKLKYSTSSGEPSLELYQSLLLGKLPVETRDKMTQMVFSFMSRINNSREQKIQGTKGFIIEDESWRVNFGMGSRSISEDRILNGDRGEIPTTTTDSQVSFYQSNPAGGYFEYRAAANKKMSRALVWQRQGVVLVLVSDNTFSEEELLKVAESIK